VASGRRARTRRARSRPVLQGRRGRGLADPGCHPARSLVILSEAKDLPVGTARSFA
jgi:hypothetical protein